MKYFILIIIILLFFANKYSYIFYEKTYLPTFYENVDNNIKFHQNVPIKLKQFVNDHMYKYKQYNEKVFLITIHLINGHFKDPNNIDIVSIVDSFTEISFCLEIGKSYEHYQVVLELTELLNGNVCDVLPNNYKNDNYVI